MTAKKPVILKWREVKNLKRTYPYSTSPLVAAWVAHYKGNLLDVLRYVARPDTDSFAGFCGDELVGTARTKQQAMRLCLRAVQGTDE